MKNDAKTKKGKMAVRVRLCLSALVANYLI